MAVNLDQARDFVYRNGTLFERALFAWLFDDGSVERVQQIALCYKNPDNGYGHGFEHDLLAPQSNPLALEYLLTVLKYTGLPVGTLLDGVSDWVESQMKENGFLKNPPETYNYPLAPWWQEDGGQNQPDAIVGNLIYFGKAKPSLIEKTKTWAKVNLTPDKIRQNKWLFMAYHAVDFCFAVRDDASFDNHRQATIENVIACAEIAPENQYYSLLPFVMPDSPIATELPTPLLNQYLDYLETAQQDDGSWLDQHDLPQWYPIVTINVLLGLRRYGRLA